MKENPLITDLIYMLKNSKEPSGNAGLFLFKDNSLEKFIPVPPSSGTGGFRTIKLTDSLGIMITNHKNGAIPIIVHADVYSENFKFTFNLSKGPAKAVVDGTRRPRLIDDRISYILSPKTSFKLELPQYSHQIWISIIIAPSLLKQIVMSCDIKFPKKFLTAIDDYNKINYFNECKYTPSIKLSLDQIISCPYFGSLKRIYLEGKAIEIIAQRLALLIPSKKHRYTSVTLTKKDIEKIKEVKMMLKTKLYDPPTIIELSKNIGLNITKLKAGSKLVLGTSIGEYVRNLKIEQARYLLEKKECNVTEAAIAVGYKSVSHFIKAFKKTYGFPPGVYVKMTNHNTR